MNPAQTEFYQVGGNIPQEALCYVRRQADTELVAALMQGDFCYVLTARQMGKSSLMVRAAGQLRAEGRAVAVIDLQALGQNVTLSQWYGQMLREIADQLDLDAEIEAFCRQTASLSPLQQWRAALREIVLRWCAAPVVLFIDEIDFVRSLPFKTDEFFAAIREFYNRRSEEPELRRLAFCLLGVATPADLIRDPRLTPFNIGRRIELTDFAAEEAAPLAAGMKHPSAAGTIETQRLHKEEKREDRSEGQGLLERVLYWTGGHPYLTQKLCRAVAQCSEMKSPTDVDRLCAEQFFSNQASREESNLQFVSSRLLQSESDLAELLGLYLQTLQGRRVADNEADARVSLLKLSGIVRGLRGRLQTRNRIYACVFNRDWVRNHLPDADLRRQRAAFLRGALRTGGVLSGFLAITCTLAAIAFHEACIAQQATERERAQRQKTERLLYADDMNIAQQAWQEGITARTVELLRSHLPGKDETDLRGFEWGALWHLTHREQRTLRGHKILVYCLAYSPDGRYLASGGFDGRVKIWEMATGQERITLEAHRPWVYAVAFSPDNRFLATAGKDGWIRLWDAKTFREAHPPLRHAGTVTRIAFSFDGKLLATAGGEERAVVRLWSVGDWREQNSFVTRHKEIYALAFSPDNRHLVTAGADAVACLWEVATGRKIHQRRAAFVYDLAFAPDGRTLAAGFTTRQIEIWDPATLTTQRTFQGHAGEVHRLAFSPDGRTLASASWDYTARLWEFATGKTVAVVKGHTQKVNAVAFAPDGRMLATGGNDQTVKLWQIPLEPEGIEFPEQVEQYAFLPDNRTILVKPLHGSGARWNLDSRHSAPILSMNWPGYAPYLFSSDGRLAALAGSDFTIHLWDIPGQRERVSLYGNSGVIRGVAFSPQGNLLASAGQDGFIRIWDTATGRERQALRSNGAPVFCVAFSPDGKTLASGGDDNTARLWDVTAGQEIGKMQGRGMRESHDHSVNAVAFSPDGRLLATASWDTTVKVWNLATRQEAGALRGHLNSVECLAFSPDGKTLASGSIDATVKLWNVPTLREVSTLRDMQPSIRMIAFSPDGTMMATLSQEGHLRIRKSLFPSESAARQESP